MVLDDGETYTDLAGCKILALDYDGIEHFDQDEDSVIADTAKRGVTEFGKVVAEFTQDGMTSVKLSGVTVTFE